VTPGSPELVAPSILPRNVTVTSYTPIGPVAKLVVISLAGGYATSTVDAPSTSIRIGLGRSCKRGAQLLEPYVDEEVSWAIRYHQALRFFAGESVGYRYPDMYVKLFGQDYKPEPSIERAYREAREHVHPGEVQSGGPEQRQHCRGPDHRHPRPDLHLATLGANQVVVLVHRGRLR